MHPGALGNAFPQWMSPSETEVYQEKRHSRKTEWHEARPKDMKVQSELGPRSGMDDLCWAVLRGETVKVR